MILNFVNQALSNSLMDQLMKAFTYMGNWGTVWILIGFILISIKKSRMYGIMLLLSILITFLIGDVLLKNLIDRPRPFISYPEIQLLIPPPSGSSMPSGHSASSFAAAFIIFKMDKRFGFGAFILAAMIAFSRIYLYVHYPSDVIAGALLGIVCSSIIYFLFKKMATKKGICL